jgi:hypothetical protein
MVTLARSRSEALWLAREAAARRVAPQRGDVVVIDGYRRGAKVALNGRTAEVFWTGEHRFRPGGFKVGVVLDGARVFLDADHVFKEGRRADFSLRRLRALRQEAVYVTRKVPGTLGGSGDPPA